SFGLSQRLSIISLDTFQLRPWRRNQKAEMRGEATRSIFAWEFFKNYLLVYQGTFVCLELNSKKPEKSAKVLWKHPIESGRVVETIQYFFHEPIFTIASGHRNKFQMCKDYFALEDWGKTVLLAHAKEGIQEISFGPL